MNNLLSKLRDVVAHDWDAVVLLNQSEVQWTSPMDVDRLRFLDGLACYHKVVEVGGEVAGFLLAMDQSAAYENENFEFFQSRYERLVYIDRIVIAKSFAGQKLGSVMYQDLFAFARSKQAEVVACEYNLKPLNVPSQAFHDGFGFRELGQQKVGGEKLVSLQVAALNYN